MMKQNKDWTDVMRDVLRDAEATPPAEAWARLERAMGQTPAPRIAVWRRYLPRVAAAAAVVLVCVGGYEFLRHGDRRSDAEEFVVASTADSGAAAQIGIPASIEVVPAADLPHKKPSQPACLIARSEPFPATAAVEEQPAPVQKPEPAAEPAPQAEPSASSGHSAAGKSHVSDGQIVAQNIDFQTYDSSRASRKRTSFGLFGGGGVTGGRGSTGTMTRAYADVMTAGGPVVGFLQRSDYNQSSFRHHLPLSFGLSVRREFAYGLSLESGVNYTLLRSDVTTAPGTEQMSQKLHFIGIPLRLNWTFLNRSNFLLYIGAGGMGEKCVAATLGSHRIEERKMQWSVMGAVGAEYRLGGHVGLFFEPDLSYYFTTTELRTSRTDSPLSFTLRLGLRLSF